MNNNEIPMWGRVIGIMVILIPLSFIVGFGWSIGERFAFWILG